MVKYTCRGKVRITKLVNVIVTFMEDIKTSIHKKLDLKKFSFEKSRELLKDYKGSLSEAVIEELRSP
ncbi:MAG: hypothetical protein DRH57_00970 [Candidatus Cloacimonadota bacterium]|nr:MAG: hypothetical protein DRH57_00970 [Candidatus Cloacimonadota bacterium]